MKRQSQTDFVKNELLFSGHISRNFALNLYHLKVRPSITKLATLISDLRLKKNWDIERKTELDSNGNKDEVYYLVKSPIKKVEYFVPDLQKNVTIYK